MSNPSFKHLNSVHFIGIGGIGMSSLARWFIAQNWVVSGSDLTQSDLIQELKDEGVKVKIGHKKANIPLKTSLIVYNQAILGSNPELKEARRRGFPCLSYPEVLGSLTRRYKTISISGAHGKSTTTALMSLILIKAGFDPTVIIGTKLREFAPPAGGNNFRSGRSEPARNVSCSKCFTYRSRRAHSDAGGYLVIEADEWKAAFLNYFPIFAILTNIDKEHLDFYKNYSNVKKTFLKFISNIRDGGILVANKDDKKLYALKFQIQKICKERDIQLIWYGGMTCHTTYRRIKNVLKVPGQHNVSNALAAYTLARILGVKEKIILKALHSYRGAWRRMEFRGYFQSKIMLQSRDRGNVTFFLRNLKIPIYDDYAHHPTEIKAALQAFRGKYPKSRIICVFQPHQADRLKRLFKDFIGAFNDADYVILLPIYQVAGRDKPHKGYTSADLAKAIMNRNSHHSHAFVDSHRVIYLPSPKKLPSVISHELLVNGYKSTVIVMMGAGNIVNYTKLLLR